MTPSAAPHLLRWAARSIGPRVARLLLAQLLLLTLAGGLNLNPVAQLIAASQVDADLRASLLVLIALATLASRRTLAPALCPPSLAALRRQPLGPASFALLTLPWAPLLAWPWALVVAFGRPGDVAAIVAAWLVGALATGGVAASRGWRIALAWTLGPLALVLLVDRADGFAWPVLLLAGTVGAVLVGRGTRAALLSFPGTPGARSSRHPPRTPLGALLAFDARALRIRLHWLGPVWLPFVITAYVGVLDANGNCGSGCLDVAALLVATCAAPLAATVLDELRRVEGARFLVPERAVPTRLRLASLLLVALAPFVPFALALAVFAREPAVLPHVAAVALAILWRALRDPTRATPIGPLLLLLVLPISVILLPTSLWFAASTAIACAFVLLVDRRAAARRRELDAAQWSFEP